MDVLQRIEHLDKLVMAQEGKIGQPTYTIRWRGTDIHPMRIKVDISFLRYRLENGRTRRKQIEYLEKNPSAPKDLFKDPESAFAQEAQHKILLEMADEKGLKKDILKEGQRQPAIITYDGYVLNGNRRLAVFRENEIQYMDCVVLPKDATPRDLYEVELDLQMAKDTKADYNWVDELLHIKYGVETLGENENVVAKKLRVSVQDIRQKRRRLMLVESYLEWLGKPGQYHLVGKEDEQAFIELEKYTKKIKDLEKEKIIRLEVFSLIKYPPSEGRLYGHLRALFKNTESVQKKFIVDLKDIEPSEKKPEDGTDDVEEKEELSVDNPMLAIAKTKTSYEQESASTVFSDPNKAKKYIENLIEAIQDADAESRDKKDKKAAFSAVREAQRRLQGVVIDSTTLEKDGILMALDEIIKIVNDLIKRVKELEKTKNS